MGEGYEGNIKRRLFFFFFEKKQPPERPEAQLQENLRGLRARRGWGRGAASPKVGPGAAHVARSESAGPGP